MADKRFPIWVELTADNKQIKTEFTKAWEVAGKSVAEWLEKQTGTLQDRISELADNMKAKIETLRNFDFNVNIDTNNAQASIQELADTYREVDNSIIQLEQDAIESWEYSRDAFQWLLDIQADLSDTIDEAIEAVKRQWWLIDETMDEAEESVKETTAAVQELNEESDKAITENGWLWKMLKFLSSKEIFNFFYRNLKKIWEKLIELSGDWEMLAKKFEPVQEKLEAVWWYVGKWLTPAVSGAIDEISSMTDELTRAGSDWSTALWMVQKWVYIIWQAFLAVVKVIKQFWAFLWTQVGNWSVMFGAFWQDIYETAKSVITWIWNADNRTALWNNIKYWIVQWVNWAIESLNWLLGWLNDKLWVNLGKIWTINPWQKQAFDFWTIDFSRTKNAMLDIAKTNSDFLWELWQEWKDFWNNAKEWAKDLEKTTIQSNKKIKEDTKKSVWWSGGWSKDSVLWAYEQMEEEAKDIWSEMTNMVEEHQKIYDKLTDEINKLWEQYDKLREEAKKTWEDAEKSLKSYNDELGKAQSEAITDLWQRYVELQKDLIWVEWRMKEAAEELSWNTIRSMERNWSDTYMWYDLKKLIDLKEKLDEIQLIEENTTEEQRKADEFLKETSKTQEILNKLKEKEAELEEQKTAAIEKQAIAAAAMAQENWKQFIKTVLSWWEDLWTRYYDAVNDKWNQIHNLDNIEYAKQLENQTENLNEQYEQLKQEKDNEVEILIDTTARKIELENEFHGVFIENVKKQERELDNLILKEQQLIEKRKEYLSLWWTSHRAYGWSVLNWQASIVWENGPETIIARQSSYVQPRNAGNSYSTINNSNSLSINGLELWNFNTIDDMLDALKERLTYRS